MHSKDIYVFVKMSQSISSQLRETRPCLTLRLRSYNQQIIKHNTRKQPKSMCGGSNRYEYGYDNQRRVSGKGKYSGRDRDMGKGSGRGSGNCNYLNEWQRLDQDRTRRKWEEQPRPEAEERRKNREAKKQVRRMKKAIDYGRRKDKSSARGFSRSSDVISQ